jgi:hypothetical protein
VFFTNKAMYALQFAYLFFDNNIANALLLQASIAAG